MTQALSVRNTIIEHHALGIAGASRHAVCSALPSIARAVCHDDLMQCISEELVSGHTTGSSWV
jgi:hypothetical protein